ncbi:MAG: FtsW/RodA/SpoVE family cell cycle protein [Bacteroidales bacterium]
MIDQISKLFRGDKKIWILFALLCTFSMLEIYSSSSTLTFNNVANHYGPLLRHIQMLCFGAAVVVVLQFIPFKYIPMLAAIGLIGSFGLLVWALIGGVELNDTSRWISIFGIQLQPSEFAKISVVMCTAFILSKTQSEDGVSRLGVTLILATSGLVTAMIISENLSTAILLAAVVFSLMLVGNVKIITLSKIALIAIVGLTLFVSFAPVKRAQTWRNRITSFTQKAGNDSSEDMNAKFEINDKNFQVSHAKIAISRGGFLGCGPGRSIQRDILPQAYSDFIFAIIIEEFGIIGAGFLMLIYILLIFRVIKIAIECDNLYGQLLALGCGLMIVYQAAINMMVGVDFGLVTGQPLPLISRGGTSTIVTCAYIGVILSISTYNKRAYPKIDE